MTHALSCACGGLTGSVAHARRATHSVCYCRDCQAFARFLGREAELLDARGGCRAAGSGIRAEGQAVGATSSSPRAASTVAP